MRLDVVSDVICPWCFIGKRNMEAALADLAQDGISFDVGFLPFQLNPDMPKGGVARREYRIAKFGSIEKSDALDARVAEAGRAAGIEFRFDLMQRTPNTLAAHRLIALAGAAGSQPAVKEALMAAYFLEGGDLESPDLLGRIAAENGVDPDLLAGDDGLEAVAAQDMAARQAGISGVPSFLMQRYLLFSGAMPPDALAENFRKARAVLIERGEG